MDKNKVIILESGARGYFGTGKWSENVIVYASHFRKDDDWMIGDLDTKTDDSYVNRSGKTCYRHRNCGTLRFNQDKCEIDIDISGRETLTCEPKICIKNGNPKILLDFNK